MPLTHGDITYRATLVAGVRYQADPPLCNVCESPVTPATLGQSYLAAPASDGPRGQYEIIECARCAGRQADQRSRERFAAAHSEATP